MTIALLNIGIGIRAQSDLEDRVKQVLLRRERPSAPPINFKDKLEEIGQPQEVAKILIDMVVNGKYAELGSVQSMLCKAATAALGELKEVSAIGPLTSTLKDQRVDKITRAYSARSLGKIDPQESKNDLLDALTDKSNYHLIRIFAAEGLAKTRDAEALNILDKQSSEEKDPYVKKMIEKSAKELRDSLQRPRSPNASPKEATEAEFGRLYSAWHQECEAIRVSSNTYDYIGLPSYRKIVAMGKPALPYLEQKMAEDKGLDFMLAFAVVEICGWDRQEFRGGSDQEFRDRVLRKLRQK